MVFENASIVEIFLNYWRITGHQRVGFLYGYYEPHKDVPLGIKATVLAIYEPPQESGRDYVKLQWPEPNEEEVNSIATDLGLVRVGWIFTDLIPEEAGTVKHLRSAETHFLTAQECCLAGHFQNVHPNPCRLAPDGTFGSKFVTVCVTGDKNNQIHMEGYQVSNQCMALVRDNCLLPTKDAPELAYVRETTKQQYVPDVFFTQKDDFGNEIKKVARTLPVEYLLVDVPVSAPVEQRYSFNPLRNKNPFPVENRSIQGNLQDFDSLSSYLRQFSKNEFLEAASDFHFILYIAMMDILPLRSSLKPLLNAVKNKDRASSLDWTKNDQWATVEQLIAAHSSEGSKLIFATLLFMIIIINYYLLTFSFFFLNSTASSMGMGVSSSNTNQNSQDAQPVGNVDDDARIIWPCSHCTFENSSSSTNCEMCGLPQSS